MVNLYRFCIAILFASLSISFACSIDSVQKYYPDMKVGIQKGEDNSVNVGYYQPTYDGKGNIVDVFVPVCLLDKDDPDYPNPKPDLTDWENCKKGKDHGFSWITIGDGNGEGESRFKQEFWACDDPDIWIVYNHPPEDKPTDPDPKPTDPDNPDPKPTDPDGEGGEGGDNGSGNGNDGGSDGGNDNGSNNGGDQNGKGLTQGEVQKAIEDALDKKGKDAEEKIGNWWQRTQKEMESEGLTLGHEANDMLDGAFAGMIIERDINDFEREYIFQIDAPKACPAPMVIALIGFEISIRFDIFCQLSEIIGYLVLASAYVTAIYILLGLRKA